MEPRLGEFPNSQRRRPSQPVVVHDYALAPDHFWIRRHRHLRRAADRDSVRYRVCSPSHPHDLTARPQLAKRCTQKAGPGPAALSILYVARQKDRTGNSGRPLFPKSNLPVFSLLFAFGEILIPLGDCPFVSLSSLSIWPSGEVAAFGELAQICSTGHRFTWMIHARRAIPILPQL